LFCGTVWIGIVFERFLSLVRFGGDLLSHVLRRSTIGVFALIGRVRDGIGSFTNAMTTKPGKRQAEPDAFAPRTVIRGLEKASCSVTSGMFSKSRLRGMRAAYVHAFELLEERRVCPGTSRPLCCCQFLAGIAAFGQFPAGIADTLLFPDQIKPIEPLVPVS
jgi:hypothetical protein